MPTSAAPRRSASGRTVLTAGVDLGGHRVVTTDGDGLAVYATPMLERVAVGPLWVTTQAMTAGTDAAVTFAGLVEEPGWAWPVDVPLWLGPDGTLTTTPPDAPWLVRVATAVTATTAFVQPFPSYALTP